MPPFVLVWLERRGRGFLNRNPTAARSDMTNAASQRLRRFSILVCNLVFCPRQNLPNARSTEMSLGAAGKSACATEQQGRDQDTELETAWTSLLRHGRPINSRPQVANLPYIFESGSTSGW